MLAPKVKTYVMNANKSNTNLMINSIDVTNLMINSIDVTDVVDVTFLLVTIEGLSQWEKIC